MTQVLIDLTETERPLAKSKNALAKRSYRLILEALRAIMTRGSRRWSRKDFLDLALALLLRLVGFMEALFSTCRITSA